MGRAEVRGNQQQQACSSGRQEDKTGQDAGCSGRQALGRKRWNGCPGCCAQSNLTSSRARVEPASKQRSVPLVVCCSAQHQEGPSRSCNASSSASASSATTQEPRRSPSTDHGTASLAYINNSPHRSCPSCRLRICTHAAFTPSTGTVPLINSEREGSRPTHRSFASPTHIRREGAAPGKVLTAS